MAVFKVGFSLIALTLVLILGTFAAASSPAASAPGATAHFAVIGDYGTASQSELDVANLVHSWTPDFVMTVGDNNYPLGEASTIDANIGQYYHDFIYPYTGIYGPGAPSNKFWPSLGNHDWYTAGAQPYLDFFTLPNNERYYERVIGPVHLFALDSDPSEPDGITYTSTQGLWLQSRLAAATEPWKLVYMHHPPYSSGLHGSTATLQWPYEQWGASAVLAGHDHDYERILNPGTNFPYFVDGLGGTSLYATGTPIPGSVVRYSDDFGAMLLDATGNTLRFQFINRANFLIDAYTLTLPLPTMTATPTRTATGTPTATRTATMTVTPSPTAICASGWQVVPSPNVAGTYDVLSGVAVVAPNDIWAVGLRGGNSNRSLIEHWDGTAWSVVPNAEPNTPNNFLRATAGSGPSDAWAVGFGGNSGGSALIEHWDGTAWSLVTAPNEATDLTAIVALAPNDAWAVGGVDSAAQGQVSLLHWNGTSWNVVPVPITGAGSALDDISAIAADNIWAVGYYADGAGEHALTLHWDGTNWTLVPTPGTNSLSAVSARTSNDVWVVGDHSTTLLHWDGSTWTTTGAFPDDDIEGIKAVGPNEAWAVGTTSNTGHYYPVLLHWDGVQWSSLLAPNPGARGAYWAIAGQDSASLWTVGHYSFVSRATYTLTMHYTNSCPTATPTPTVTPTQPTNTPTTPPSSTPIPPSPTATPSPIPTCGPAWRLVPAEQSAGPEDALWSVAVVDANDIWAVGNTTINTAGNRQALIEHWNGNQWSIVPSPNMAGPNNNLEAVAAVTTNDVWAVGFNSSGSLIEHWDGTQWSIVPAPGYELEAIGVVNAHDIWAAGDSMLHWDGTVWTSVPHPGTGLLRDFAILNTNNIWVVGHSPGVIEHWDGTQWSLAPIPTPNAYNALVGIAAVNPNDIWSVGFTSNYTTSETFIIHWDGQTWTRVPSPNQGSQSTELFKVGIRGPNDIWAIGDYGDGLHWLPLTMHWDGTAWTIVPSIPGGGGYTRLGVLGVVPGGAMWATGCCDNRRALVERYSDPCLTPTPTPIPSATPCPVQFVDVPPGSTFYDFVRCLACRGIVSGYPCGGPGEPCPGTYFRPNANVTRGQVAKIVSESAGFSNAIPSTQWTFQDVPPGGTFWLWVERLSGRGIIGGYACGGPFEPCVAPDNRPYFRPNNAVTRGQLAKIVSGAAGWTETPSAQTFQDVAPGSTFYVYVERVARRGIVSGYPCGGVGEPCIAPNNRAYFRPSHNATRGQMSKIAASAFFPNCATPAQR